MVARERGPVEPRSMYSRSRRRRDRDRRHAILQAQAQSYVLKRLLWHRPRDDVAGATGQGDVSYVAPETIDLTSSSLESISYVGMSSVDVTSNTESGDPLSAAPSGYTGSKLGETVGLDMFASGTGSLDSEGSNPESIGHTCSKLGETANLEVNTFASETCNFKLTGRVLESISCLGKDDPPRAASLSHTHRIETG